MNMSYLFGNENNQWKFENYMEDSEDSEEDTANTKKVNSVNKSQSLNTSINGLNKTGNNI